MKVFRHRVTTRTGLGWDVEERCERCVNVRASVRERNKSKQQARVQEPKKTHPARKQRKDKQDRTVE